MIDTTIIDNVLPQSLADDFENLMCADVFPWFFISDITYAKDKGDISTPGHQHCYYNPDEGVTSNFFSTIAVIPTIVFDKIGYTNRPNIIRAKAFMQLPLIRPEGYLHNNCHTDMSMPHVVCLYYVNNSEGDTFIYDKYDKKLTQQITPKKNRVVVFDGSIYHASSLPTKNKRIILNFNVAPSVLDK